MHIICVDDEMPALNNFRLTVAEFADIESLQLFQNAADALNWASEHEVDVAFLDMEMPGLCGLEMAKRLKEINSDIRVVFVTAYSRYALEAFGVDAIGYVLKPYTRSEIRKELDKAARVKSLNKKRLRVQTFGKFEVFVDEEPLIFRYNKTKEMLAYLIDRNGAMCSNGELIAVLWEDEDNMSNRISYLKNLRTDLLGVLEKHGCKDVVVRGRAQIGIVKDKVQCDYYDWLENKDSAGTVYRGEYMQQYAWAEITHAYLDTE